jgi:hypothetical protein
MEQYNAIKGKFSLKILDVHGMMNLVLTEVQDGIISNAEKNR